MQEVKTYFKEQSAMSKAVDSSKAMKIPSQ